MAVNIKNLDVENLLNEVVNLTGETKTEAIRRPLKNAVSGYPCALLIQTNAKGFLLYLKKKSGRKFLLTNLVNV